MIINFTFPARRLGVFQEFAYAVSPIRTVLGYSIPTIQQSETAQVFRDIVNPPLELSACFALGIDRSVHVAKKKLFEQRIIILPS